MFLDYSPDQTFLHRLDVRTKCMGFIAITLFVFLFSNPLHNLILAFTLILVAVLIRMPFQIISRLLKPLIPIFIIMFLITGLTYPASKFTTPIAGHQLFHLFPGGGLAVTSGGLLYGLTLVIRIFVMVISSTLLTFTTPIDDFLDLLQKMKVPHEIAFVVATGIRFIPTLEKKSQQVITAQKVRGTQELSGGMIQRIKSFIPVMIPLIVDSIRMSENLAIAMQNRSFGAFKQRTSFIAIRMKPVDYLLSLLFLIFIGAIFFLKHMNWGIL